MNLTSLRLIVLVLLLGPLHAYAKTAVQPLADQTMHRQSASQAMVNIDLDNLSADVNALRGIDLKRAVVRIVSLKITPDDQIKQSKVLELFVSESAKFPVIAGFAIESRMMLTSQDAENLAKLSGKASFISAKFQFKNVEDWKPIFQAQSRNGNLLTVIYGSEAMQQLETTRGMGDYFANANVPLVHVMTEDTPSGKEPLFWRDVASTIKSNKKAMAIVLLDTNNKNKLDYSPIIKTSIEKSDGYLMWMTAGQPNHFSAINKAASSLLVWQLIGKNAQAIAYERINSPQSFYMSLGMARPAFDILSILAIRAQKASEYGVNLVGDAENNVHTYTLLLDMANTTVINDENFYLPPYSSYVNAKKANILIMNPAADIAQQIVTKSQVLEKSIKQNNGYLGIFDYSIFNNSSFYEGIGPLLGKYSGIELSYNTSNLNNLKNLLLVAEKYNVKQIYLGREASILYKKLEKNDRVKINLS